MFTFVALYANPNDADAFTEYYRTTHADIVRQWPGVTGMSITTFDGTPRGGEPPYALKGEVHFNSRDDFMTAMQSEFGQASQQDARTMVEQFGVKVTMLVGETNTG